MTGFDLPQGGRGVRRKDAPSRLLLAGHLHARQERSIKRVDVYGDQHLEGDDCGDPLGFRHGGHERLNTAAYDDASAFEYMAAIAITTTATRIGSSRALRAAPSRVSCSSVGLS